MNRERELELADRIRAAANEAAAAKSRNYAAPADREPRPTPIPVDVYTDPERHDRELTAIRRSPQLVAHSSELADPGDRIATTIGGIPIIVTRIDRRDGGGDAPTVAAMVNACAHRGAPVVEVGPGHSRILSCGFHGWSYDLDGSLRSVSEAESFGADPPCNGLTRLAAEERHGAIWVIAEPTIDNIDVRGWLGADLDDLLTDVGLGDLVHHRHVELDIDCNWKMLTDGFLETYHLKYLHRNTIAPYFPSNILAVDALGDHLGGLLPKNRLLRQFEDLPREEWNVLDHVTMAFVLVPGTVFQWQAGHAEVFSLRPDPVDATRSRVRLSLIVHPDRADDTELWDRNWDRLIETIPGEDFDIAQRVQANIAAGVVGPLQLGSTEWALRAHLDRIDKIAADQAETGA